MAVTPHPSLTLVLNVAQEQATPEARLEVSRCWAHVCSCVLRAAPAGQPNSADFLVKFGTQRYLSSAEPGADALWDEVVETYLYNLFHKVGNNFKIFNRRQREVGNPELFFERLNVVLEDGAATVAVRLDSQSDIAPATARMLGQVRRAYNEGLLGKTPVHVEMPSAASWKAQVAAAAQQKAEDAERAAREKEKAAQAAQAAAEEAAARAEEDFAPAPDLVQPDPAELDEERIRAELEAKFALPPADFAVDYTRWDVQLDGVAREFDSAAWAFVDGEAHHG